MDTVVLHLVRAMLSRSTQSFSLIKMVTRRKPERGEQYEVGHHQPSSFDGYFNIAAFEVSKENLARQVAGQLTQIGEVRNRGLELEAVANVTEALIL